MTQYCRLLWVGQKLSIYESPLFLGQFETIQKLKKQLDTLTNKVTIFSEDIRMEFGISKCGAVIMRRKEFSYSNRIDLTSGENILEVDQEEKIKYLGILENDGILLECFHF